MVRASFLFYVLAIFSWQVYVLQAVNGIRTALRYSPNSPIMSFFTRYIDKGHESLDWGLDVVSTSLGRVATSGNQRSAG